MRHVYFSFHYADVWKVNQIRNSGVVGGARSAGFADRSLWEEAKAKNRRELEKMIADGLTGTSVTAVLIGRETATRPWVRYEIEQSFERGNALLGVHLHTVKGTDRRTAKPGSVPPLLKQHGANVYSWTNAKDFGEWVEAAWRVRNAEPSALSKITQFFGFGAGR